MIGDGKGDLHLNGMVAFLSSLKNPNRNLRGIRIYNLIGPLTTDKGAKERALGKELLRIAQELSVSVVLPHPVPQSISSPSGLLGTARRKVSHILHLSSLTSSPDDKP